MDMNKVFEDRLVRVGTDFQNRIAMMLTSKELNSRGKPLFSKTKIQHALGTYTDLIQTLKESGYSKLFKLFQSPSLDIIKAAVGASIFSTAFTQTSSDVIKALYHVESYLLSGVSDVAMSRIKDVVMSAVLTGTQIESMLPYISDALEESQKHQVVAYTSTLRSYVTQAVHDYAAESYGGELFWEYVGPEDNATRQACLELLAIGYFTNEQRRIAEANSAVERGLDCRHVFQQITQEEYEALKGESKLESHQVDMDKARMRLKR